MFIDGAPAFLDNDNDNNNNNNDNNNNNNNDNDGDKYEATNIRKRFVSVLKRVQILPS